MNTFVFAAFRWLACFCLFCSALGQAKDKEETWAIYWYLCGSDLESQNGAASADLEEMLDADLPENVKVCKLLIDGILGSKRIKLENCLKMIPFFH